MIKIQKMSFRAIAKNLIIHLQILELTLQNYKKSSVLRTAPLQRSKKKPMNLQNETELQRCQQFKMQIWIENSLESQWQKCYHTMLLMYYDKNQMKLE